ncbi:MAG: hypothetical protein K2M44_07480 [Clostridia bacterium]|nr:hypothetical protein [Clostridia bacterium]
MTKQPKRLKAQMWDKMQYLFRNYYDRMLHVRIDFDGMLDIAALKAAYMYMLERVPVLHSRYHNNFIKPYWSVKKIDIDSVVTLKQYSDMAKAARAADEALVREIPAQFDAQIKVTIIRCGGKDILVQLLNHMCMDGGDTKSFIKTLSQVYTEILDGRNPDVPVKTGDRSHWQLYTGFDEEKRKIAKGLYKNVSRVKDKIKFPFVKGGELKPHVVVKRLDEETFDKLKAYAKSIGATVNDIILAAYIRELYKATSMDKDKPLGVPCMVDLRRYIDIKDSYGYSNHVGFMISHVDRLDDDAKATALKVKRNSDENKADPYMGLYALPLLNLAYAVFPQFIAEIAISIGYDNPYTGLSNIGLIADDEADFGALKPLDLYITGAIKKKPYMQLSLYTFRKIITFTIAVTCSDEDRRIISSFLDGMLNELYNIIA